MGGIRISDAEVASAVNQVNGAIENQVAILSRILNTAAGFAGEEGLSGTTYDSMKNYFSDCYVPTIQAMIIFLTEWKGVNDDFQGIVSLLVDGQIDVENLWEVVYGIRQSLVYFETLGLSAEASQGLQMFLSEQEETLQELEEDIRKAETCSQMTAGLYGTLSGSLSRVEQGLSYVEGSSWDVGTGTYSYQHPSRAWREEVASEWKHSYEPKLLKEIDDYWREKQWSGKKWWQDEGELLEAIRILAVECKLRGLSYLDIARLYDQNGTGNPRLMALEELTGAKVDGIYLGDNLDALKAILLNQGIVLEDVNAKLDGEVMDALLDWFGTSSVIGRKIIHALDNGWGDVIGGVGIIAGGFAMQQVGKAEVWKEGAGGAKSKINNIKIDDLTDDILKTKPKNSPNPEKWLNKKGNISIDESGTWKYTSANGQSVKYSNGYPDFKEAGLVKQEVDIGGFNNYASDFKKADALAPNGPRDPINSTWHHSQDGRTLQEVDKLVHKEFTHKGGMSLKKK